MFAFRSAVCCLVRLGGLATAAACLCMSAGCTVTTQGMEQKETSVEEVFPPSRTVASYRRRGKPKRLPRGKERRITWGRGKSSAALEKWNALSQHYCDYGIPGRKPKVRLVVAEFSSKENAYGAFTALRPENIPPADCLKLGVQGVLTGGRLYFIQGRFLVCVRDLSSAAGPEQRTVLVEFGLRISERLPHDISDVPAVGKLPLHHRVPGSEKFHRESPLGLGIIKRRAATARYRFAERRGLFFVVNCKLGGGYRSVLKKLRAAMKKEGAVRDATFGEKGYAGTLNGRPATIAARRGFVFGVVGNLDPREVKALLADTDGRIRPYADEPFKSDEEKKSEEEKNKSGYRLTL